MKVSKSLRKMLFLGLAVIPLTVSLIPTDASADRYSGGRSSAVFDVWYSDSVHSYGYTGMIDEARFAYNAASTKVDMFRVISSSGTPDKYYVGTTTVPELGGAHLGYKKNSSGSYVRAENYERWVFSTVSYYWNVTEWLDLSPEEKQSNVSHEMGHALGLDHTYSGIPSIMKSGRSPLRLPTSYDISEIRLKWGN